VYCSLRAFLTVPYVKSVLADIGPMMPLEQNDSGSASRAANRPVLGFSASCFVVTRTAAFDEDRCESYMQGLE
jgi:hypothetical protein